MEINFTNTSKTHLLYWKKSGNLKIQKKITLLILAIQESYFTGIGKPEPLKHNLSGLWSRRINKEHRLVYEINETNNKIIIHSLKGHY